MAFDLSVSAVDPRPLEPVDLATATAVKNLVNRLEKAYGLQKQYADAIARAVVDPTAVRNQLDYPLIKRFPGGIAKFIVADVYTPAISASPVNPRETESRIYPTAATDGEKVCKPLGMMPDPDGQPGLRIIADNQEHANYFLAQSEAKLLSERTDLREAISVDGVLEPITVAIAEFTHNDRTPSAVVPIAVDGSSRITQCHDLAGFRPEDVVYRWPQANSREWRGILNQILSCQERPISEVTEDEAQAHRAMVCQARILIAVEPVRGGRDVSVVSAVRAIVGAIHVAQPKEWSQGAQLDEVADAVLDQLEREGRIDEQHRYYLAGLYSPAEAKEKGFSEHNDDRAAHIAATLLDRRNMAAVSLGYRSVMTDKQRLGNNARPDLATELILRSFRTNFTPKQVTGLRSVMQRTINFSDFRDVAWQATDRTPKELLKAALAELKGAGAEVGANCIELGIRAIYWLISKGALTRDTRASVDQRGPSSVVRALMSSEHGLRQLYQALIDGRAGHQYIHAVDEEGNLRAKAGGGVVALDDDRLRRTFPSDRKDDAYVGPAVEDTIEAPEVQLSKGFKSLRGSADAIYDLVEGMKRVRSDGAALVMSKGMPTPLAEDIAKKLRKATNQIELWGLLYQSQQPGKEDEVDLLDEEMTL